MTNPSRLTGSVPFEMRDRLHVPRERYFNREFFELEKRYLWPRVWQMACRLEEVPEPGDYVEYEISDQSIIVVRQPDRSVKAFYNACRHRATELVQGRGPPARRADRLSLPWLAVEPGWQQLLRLWRGGVRGRMHAARRSASAGVQGGHLGWMRVDQHGPQLPTAARSSFPRYRATRGIRGRKSAGLLVERNHNQRQLEDSSRSVPRGLPRHGHPSPAHDG